MAAEFTLSDWRARLRCAAELPSIAEELGRALVSLASGGAAAIFLLDQAMENFFLYGFSPSVHQPDRLHIPYGKVEDPLTLCVLKGRRINVRRNGGLEDSLSLKKLQALYGKSFKSASFQPLFGHGDRLIGAAAVMDSPEVKFIPAADEIIDYGALLIDGIIERNRHLIHTKEIIEDFNRFKTMNREGDALVREMIGQSPAIKKVRKLIRQAARNREAAVLLTGETGTGKELAAGAIHRLSGGGPFIKVDCASIPPHLLESELFGCLKGAFTGAERDREGLIASADGGTVLLDEIGEMPMEMQAKLLRLLQERQVRPVGDVASRPVDVMFIAATNIDLAQAQAEKRFRTDLYYRLAVFPIHLPPLKERREDIPLLAAHFLKKFSERVGRTDMALNAAAQKYLFEKDYAGNIRELAACVERAVMLAEPGTSVLPREAFMVDGQAIDFNLAEKVALYEVKLIDEALAAAGGNQAQAAQVLGIPRRTLSHKVRKLSQLLRDRGSRQKEAFSRQRG